MVSDKENMETPTSAMGHKLTNREETLVKARMPEESIGNEEVPPAREEMRTKKSEEKSPIKMTRTVCPKSGTSRGHQN